MVVGGVCEVEGCGSSGGGSGVVFCSSLSGSSICSGAVMVAVVVAIVVETFYRQHSVVFCVLSLLLVLYSSCSPSSCRAMSVLFIFPHGRRCLHLTIRTYIHTCIHSTASWLLTVTYSCSFLLTSSGVAKRANERRGCRASPW